MNEPTSDTPRTDIVAHSLYGQPCDWKDVADGMLEHARTLERELNEANAKLALRNKQAILTPNDPELVWDTDIGWLHRDSLVILNQLRAYRECARDLAAVANHIGWTSVDEAGTIKQAAAALATFTALEAQKP